MFSFFKKKSKEAEQVPEWAYFLSKEEYQQFDIELNKYLRTLNIPYTINDGTVEVSSDLFGFNKLGLTNVAQVCKQNSFSDYYKSISHHFETMIRANDFNRAFKKIEHDYEQVKQYLCVRIYDHEYIEHIGRDNTVGKDIAGDIYAMLVFDLPHAIVSISADKTKKWNQSIQELFDTGVANARERYPLSISREDLSDFKIWLAQCDHFFAGNIVFELPHKKELIGSYGSLVAIPHRHAAIIYPIESLEVVNAINKLVPIISGMHQEGPGSVSNNLLWYTDGIFTNIPYSIEEQTLRIIPPENFITMINSLGQ